MGLRRPAPSAPLLLCIAAACTNPLDEPESEFRCAGALPSGLIGLELVDIAGTPTISGVDGNVFSNERVQLAGNFDMSGAAVSGGTVTISGTRTPHGGVVEGAAKITATDPTDAVVAHASANDNATIPCVKQGSACTSPVVAGVLTLVSKQTLELQTGSYYFTGISMSGQSKLNVRGTVVVYLAGGATFNGGSAANPSSDTMQVVSSSSAEIKINGGGSTNMAIQAPFAAVRFAGTQAFQGSVIAKQLIVSGTADLIAMDNLLDGEDVTCRDDVPPHGGR